MQSYAVTKQSKLYHVILCPCCIIVLCFVSPFFDHLSDATTRTLVRGAASLIELHCHCSDVVRSALGPRRSVRSEFTRLKTAHEKWIGFFWENQKKEAMVGLFSLKIMRLNPENFPEKNNPLTNGTPGLTYG